MRTRTLQKYSLLALGTVLAVAGGISTRAADLSNGSGIYSEHCESCHGPGGEGMGGMGELRPWQQLMKPDGDLFNTIRDGGFAMPGFDGLLTGEEILDVIAYMRTFQ